MLSFNKNFLTLQIPLKEGLGRERRPKDRVNLRISLIYLEGFWLLLEGFVKFIFLYGEIFEFS